MSAARGAQVMQCLRDQVLAGSGLSRDQDRAIVRRDAADFRKQIPHERAVSDDSLKLGRREHLAFELHRSLPFPYVVHQPGDAFAQCADRDRFIQIIRGALFDRLDGRFGGIVRRHQDHFDRRIEFHGALEHFKAAHARHDQIGQHDLRTPFVDDVEAGFRIGCRQNFGAGLRQRGRKHFETTRMVVNDQQRNGRFCRIHRNSRSTSSRRALNRIGLVM